MFTCRFGPFDAPLPSPSPQTGIFILSDGVATKPEKPLSKGRDKFQLDYIMYVER